MYSTTFLRKVIFFFFVLFFIFNISCDKKSEDTWTKYTNNPILSPEGKERKAATWADVLKVGDKYHMYYHCINTVGHATSNDGKSWTKDTTNNPVLEPSSSPAWDDNSVGVPVVWKEGNIWYMLYRGANSSQGSDATGLATSSNGINWTKDTANNPVLVGEAGQWDEGGAEIGAGGIIKVDSIYYAFYEANGGGRKIGVATSTDLVNWTKDPHNPIYSGGRFCPSIFKYESYYYMLVPHYTIGSNYSQIELYQDTNPTFYPSSREFVKIAIDYGSSGEWDSHDQDTPVALTDNIYRNSFNATNNELWVYYGGENEGIWQEGMIIESDIDRALQPGERKYKERLPE